MTRIFERREFNHFLDRDSGALFEDVEFRRCSFIGCSISTTRNPSLRSTVRNVRLVGCEQRGCDLDAAVVEEVLVDGLKTNGLFHAWGAVYRHVTLRGRIGRVMTSPLIATGTATAEEQRAFATANAAYYATVDWALDISEAEFEECDLRGVPAALVRRDPATQVVVTREKAMQGLWRQLDLKKTYWPTGLEFFLERGEPDVVLVAPKRDRNFQNLLDGLKLLRDSGVAEPD